jgi:hypothetical protein
MAAYLTSSGVLLACYFALRNSHPAASPAPDRVGAS